MVRHVMLIAPGERQDKLAANCAKELHRYFPDWYLSAVGGEQLRAAGAEVFMDYARIENARSLNTLSMVPQLNSVISSIKRRILQAHPDLLVVIGMTPQFLAISRFAKAHGVKVLGVMLPKRWCWRANDMARLIDSVDHVACVYPYIQNALKSTGVSSSFIGLPLPPLEASALSREQAREALSLYSDKPVVGLMPGNTLKELKRFLPMMLSVAEDHPECRFVLALAPNLSKLHLKNFKSDLRELGIWIVKEQTDVVLKASDVALCTNGRISLEAARMKTPVIVVEKCFGLRKERFMTNGMASLCNLLADKPIVPELCQQKANARAMSKALSELLDDTSSRDTMIAHFEALSDTLQTKRPVAHNLAVLVGELVGEPLSTVRDSALACELDSM